jgi:hypothetical protein
MCQSDKRLDIKSRLGEIDRKFAKLTAVSSNLAHMAERLARLRRVNERICLFIDRSSDQAVAETMLTIHENSERNGRCYFRTGMRNKVPEWH